ncbi:MAG: hypothetical protein IPG38_16465 [Chitinophagaceae bacterium]|nr:hypothetical protein [Chitinophagaceae bacterium]
MNLFAASAIADKDSVIIRLHCSSFHQLLKENPELHFKFTRLLAQRLRFKFLILKELAIITRRTAFQHCSVF